MVILMVWKGHSWDLLSMLNVDLRPAILLRMGIAGLTNSSFLDAAVDMTCKLLETQILV